MTTVRVPRDTDLIIPDRMPYIVIIVDDTDKPGWSNPSDRAAALRNAVQRLELDKLSHCLQLNPFRHHLGSSRRRRDLGRPSWGGSF